MKVQVKNYPSGGSWLPRDREDVAQLVESAIQNSAGRVNPMFGDIINTKESKQGVANRNLQRQFLYGVTDSMPPTPGQQGYDQLVQDMVASRRFMPQQYDQIMSQPKIDQVEPTDFYNDVQRKTPYTTILQENFQNQIAPTFQHIGQAIGGIRDNFLAAVQKMFKPQTDYVSYFNSGVTPMNKSLQNFVNGAGHTEQNIQDTANGF